MTPIQIDESLRATLMPRDGARWAVYRNVSPESSTFGQPLFLLVGPDCTHKEPPKHAPDSSMGAGWKFLFVGFLSDDASCVKVEGGEDVPVIFADLSKPEPKRRKKAAQR